MNLIGRINNSEERFKLHLSATSTHELAEQEALIYSWRSSVYINDQTSVGYSSVEIIDLAGRVIYSGAIIPGELNRISLKEKKGIYLDQLYSESQSQVKKR